MTSPMLGDPDVGFDEGALATERRRDFHKHAEPGWCEIRTASLIARRLEELGFEVRVGAEVLDEERMGLPPADELADAFDRALAHGADPEYAERVAGGLTGVVGIIRGEGATPVTGLRFDIDANYGHEANEGHQAAELGYVSINEGRHHNCGHDAHAAIGLGIAERLAAARSRINGEVRLIFQPAEEGLRGGPAMVRRGVADGVQNMLGCHIGVQALETGTIIAGYNNILASRKFDITFAGRNAHAGISPHEGRNALQAAAIAVQNLLAIGRHGDGETRINVGTLEGGESRNSIPAWAFLRAEVRGDTNSIIDRLSEQVIDVVEGAARICGVTSRIDVVGGAEAASTDPEFASIITRAAERVDGVTKIQREADFKGSDDMASFMVAVQESGGLAAYFGLGSALSDFHHAPHFDIDDRALLIGIDVFWKTMIELGSVSSVG